MINEVPERIWINPISLIDDLHREHARLFLGRQFQNDIEYVRVDNDAATRMRDRCVAKVKRARKAWGGAAMPGHAVDQLIDDLKSLTLEHEQEK